MFIVQDAYGKIEHTTVTRAEAIKLVKKLYEANKDAAPYMVYDCKLDHVEYR